MRARFELDRLGHVTVTYDDDGKRRSREFRVIGRTEGYVYEVFGDGCDPRQVCEGLAHYGNTLYCRRENLPNVIRREFKAMRRGSEA